MTDKEIKKEITQIIPKLANIEFTKDDEIEFYKNFLTEIDNELRRKEQECEEMKKEKDLYKVWYRAKHDDWADVFIKNVKRNNKFKEGLKEIYNLIGKLKADCVFGDKNCDNCNHEDDIDCNFYIQKVIKQICDKLLT